MRGVTGLAWALPVGLATGLAGWLLAGGASAGSDKLDGIEAQLIGLRAPIVRRTGGEVSGSDLLSAPLFALTTGPGAIREPAIRLDGVSVSRRRVAALVSVDGKPAAWLAVGETRDGVTVQAVTASSASFETALGAKSLNLGEQSAASSPDPHAPANTATAMPPAPDGPPPGLRKPLEPATAPPRR